MTAFDQEVEDGACVHGVWPAAMCHTCNGNLARERAAAASTRSMWPDAVGTQVLTTTEAAYPSTCPNCQAGIDPGDMICLMDNKQWWCESCGT